MVATSATDATTVAAKSSTCTIGVSARLKHHSRIRRSRMSSKAMRLIAFFLARCNLFSFANSMAISKLGVFGDREYNVTHGWIDRQSANDFCNILHNKSPTGSPFALLNRSSPREGINRSIIIADAAHTSRVFELNQSKA